MRKSLDVVNLMCKFLLAVTAILTFAGVDGYGATCPPGTFPAVTPLPIGTGPQAALTFFYDSPILDANALQKFATPLPNPLDPGFIFTPAGTQGGENWYAVSMRQITQSAGLIYNNAASASNGCTASPARFWVYGDARDNGIGGVAPTAGHSYPGPTFEVNANQPVRVTWTNELPPAHIVSLDPTLDCGPTAPNCWPYNRTVVHLHGSHVADDSDGHPDAWFSAGFASTGHTWAPNTRYGPIGTYRYDNSQEGSTLWYHDHAMGQTRINAYAGLAGFYIIRDANEQALQAPVAGPAPAPAVLPRYPYEVPIVIQDRVFDTNGQLMMPDKPLQDLKAKLVNVPCDSAAGAVAPYACGANPPGTLLPNTTECDPVTIGTAFSCPAVKFRTDPVRPGALVPDPAGTLTAPTITPEFFGNVILVNGQAWPKLDVEPRVYRIRMLNGSDSRSYILRLMLKNLASGAVTAPPAGLDLWQIGTEQGLLNAPVKPMANDPTVPAPPAIPPFPQTNAIVITPGERVDMLIDFKRVPSGSAVLLQNIGPDRPYNGDYPPTSQGALANRQAASTAVPEIMVFNVTVPFNPAVPDTLDPSLIGAAGQRGLRPAPIAPLTDTVGATPKKLYLAERSGAYGRPQMTINGIDFMQAISELTKLNDTETWEFYNLTPDAHPMHLHLVAFQVIDRQGLIDPLTGLPYLPPKGRLAINTPVAPATVVLDPAGPTSPAPNEVNAWKDTIYVPPGMVTRVRAKFDIPGLYVYHCHILTHEENSMMRPYVVTTPATQVSLASSVAGNSQPVGTANPVTFTASGLTGILSYPESNGFEYSFTLKSPANIVSPLDNLTMMVPGSTAGYSPVRTATWTPPQVPGPYVVTVNAKAIGAAAVAPNIVTTSINFVIVPPAAPAVSGATSTTAAGSFNAGKLINITLAFSQAISSTGLTIGLNSGGSVATGPLNNVSGYNGTYTVAAGENATALDVVSITGTITDSALNSAVNPVVPAGFNISGSKTIRVDTIAPSLSVATPAAGALVNATPLTVSGTVGDLNGIQGITVNGTAATPGIGGVFSATAPLAAGVNTITIMATDMAGNSTNVVRDVTFDAVVPVTAASPVPGSYTGPITVTLTAGKAGATIRYSTDGTTPTGTSPVYTGPFVLDAMTATTFTVRFFAVDAAGNTEAVNSAVYTIHVSDLTNASVTINNGAQFTNTQVVTLALTATDPLGVTQMQVACDGVTFGAAEPFVATRPCTLAAGDGLKSVAVKYIDSVNTVYNPVIAQITLDTALPVTMATPGPGTYGGSVSVTLAVSEVATIHYTTNGMAPTTASVKYTGPILMSSATTAPISLKFFAVDQAGNAEAVQALTYTIHVPDLTQAAVSINSGALFTNTPNVILALSASDPLGVPQMQVACDGVIFGASEPFAVSRGCTVPTGDGLKTVAVKFIDGLGTIYPPIPGQITLDNTAPVASATPVAGTYNSTLTLQLAANETAKIYYTIDGTMPSAIAANLYAGPVTLVSSTTGYTVSYFAVDQAGNSSAPKSAVYTVQSASLVGSILINGGSAYTTGTTVNLTLSAIDPAGVTQMQFSNDGVNFTPLEAYAVSKTWNLDPGVGVKAVYVRYRNLTGAEYTSFASIIYETAVVSASNGDLNGDNTVDIRDALRALQISIGMMTPTVSEQVRGDVAPLLNGISKPDGVIDIADALMILRRALGMVTW